MKQFDIFISYVAWVGGGKKRPVLVLLFDDKNVTVYQITSKYENKSEHIRSKYFKIIDWKQAGLSVQSYVDTNDTFEIARNAVDTARSAGRLTDADKKRLLEFLEI